ncbi:MAG: hypothetical protein ABF477_07425 [Leuconostoc pseudomesenteroides]|uniref:hypothetical protein n=1 Tax=Leuconostoc pseudomesenteroides TaxID=33968 RepID=UPI0039E8B29D
MGYLDSEDLGDIAEEAFALANPLTREWAHDKFVEKEKRYVWKLNGLYLVKAIDDDGSIYFGSHDASMALSTSQIKEWGFNPEMFDREEV